jgi:hypothetical protein
MKEVAALRDRNDGQIKKHPSLNLFPFYSFIPDALRK